MEIPPPLSPEPVPASIQPPSSLAAPETLPPPALPLAAPAPPPAPAGVPFVFHGEAREFFRIWIVNTLLTILTLGIFNAWAKVRKRRYFRGNTELLGDRFEYTADPKRLLIGNIIVVGLFLAYGLFGAVYPAMRVIALLLFIALLPWIVVRSFAFNAHHTRFRGLRFRFHPSVSAAALLYLGKPLLIVVTLGLYYPAWARERQEFILSRHRLGTSYFHLKLATGGFYFTYLTAFGIMLVAGMLMAAVSAGMIKLNHGHAPDGLQLLPTLAISGLALFIAKQLIFAQIFRRVWNEAKLDEHQFRTHLKTGTWMKLQMVNLLAMVGTCGLAYPWAAVRSTRYLVSQLEFVPAGPVETIAAINSTTGSAVGDTAAEFAGLDFGL